MTTTADLDTPGQGPLHRVVVTGAAGFLGSHVVEQLSSVGGYDVVATDVVRSPRAEALAALPGVRFTAADLRDTAALDDLVAGSDALVHLAAVRMQAAASNPREAYEINVGATYDLLVAASAHNVPRFVYGSSHTVYGAFQDPEVPFFHEVQGAVRPGLSMYAASKLASEAFVESFANVGGPDYLTLRLGTIYGPRANRDSNSGILLDMLSALDRGERPQVPWTRDSLHALIYVDDAAAAVVRALSVPEGRMAVNAVGVPITSKVIYETMVKMYGGDPDAIEWREDRARYQRVSSQRMRTVLGIENRTSLADGLDALIAWHRSTQVAAR